MFGTRMLRSLVALLAAVLVVFSYPAASVAQSTDQSMQARMRDLQQQIDELNSSSSRCSRTRRRPSSRSRRTTAGQQVSAGERNAKTVRLRRQGIQHVHEGLLRHPGRVHRRDDQGHGRHGGLPVLAGPRGHEPHRPVRQDPPGRRRGPYGRVSWMAMMSSNGSNVGYRGNHQIGTTDVDFIYQVSTAIDMAAAPGLNDTWTKSSNTVHGGDRARRHLHRLPGQGRPGAS